jgi:hypothetical protein
VSKKYLVIMAIIFLSEGLVSAQSDVSRPRLAQPQLRSAQSKLDCEDAEADGYAFVRCAGENILLQISPDTPLHLVLDSYLLTQGLKNTTLTRSLVLQSPVESRYWGKYAERETPILTQITGHSSDLKDRAWLEIEPRRIKLYVGPTDYIAFAIKDEHPIYLKPGLWELNLDCSIKQIVTPDGQSWTRQDDAEVNIVKNGRFGLDRNSQPVGDLFTGVSSFPGGAMVYSVTQLRDLWKFLTHRPNMTLPTGTDLYFQINGIKANYVSPLPPTSPAIALKKDAIAGQ